LHIVSSDLLILLRKLDHGPVTHLYFTAYFSKKQSFSRFCSQDSARCKFILKLYTSSQAYRAAMLLSCPAKKVTKECGLRRRYENAPSLRIHPPLRHPTPENVPIFGHLHRANLKLFSGKRSKIGTFLDAGRRGGAGVS
jgi:hypothetical protein